MAHPVLRLFGVLATVTALVAVPLTGAVAGPLRTADYPSWDDVQAAKQNEASAQAEADRISGLLDELEATAVTLSNEALKRGEEYLVATYNRDAAQTSADDLVTRATEAAATAQTTKTQVGQIAAQLYKSGGDNGAVNLLLNGDKSDELLYKLGTMSQLTRQTVGLRDAAEIAANTAASLRAQADAALAERDRLATEAETALEAAEDAQAAVDAQVREEKAHSATLYEQLASLKNTTAAAEQGYRDGLAKAAEEAARKAAAEAEAAATAAANGAGGDGSSWVPDSSSVASPAEAKAYASSVLGNYSWGSDQYGCLVTLWNGESGWRVNAYNTDSGAYGIPQSLPANKMSDVAPDWPTNAATQITWGLNYISGRYGSPCNALAFWNGKSPHWY
ncbi:coiled-coil domain-containing protein [Agreia sp.]|uniref:coiled-coil domain-containing protein n=1 Tax=Agreia sp. TaxID=1872416 RepID=UPI0035BBE497